MEFEAQIVNWHSDDEWALIKTWDASHAATEIAKEHFWQDPCAPSNFSPTIRVRKVGSNAVMTFNITAETSVDFFASLESKHDQT